MNELFAINTDGNEPTVSARDLHKALGIRKRFSEWFEKNSQGFIENEDFSNPYLKVRVQIEGGREVQREVEDFDLSVDMAKHICLMSRTDKGRECRQRLIDLEKAWNTPEQVMARALKMAGKTIDSLKDRCKFLGGQVVEQQKLIEEMTPKAIFADAVATSHTSILIGDLAKILKQNGVETGQKRLFEWLRENGYLSKRKGTEWNSPTQKSMNLGLFEVKETTAMNPDGSVRINKTTKVTGKGQQYFINKFLNVA